MGLVSEVVEMLWSPSNRKYYENKGYVFTNFNDTFKVKVIDLSKGSTAEVKIKCDFCGNIVNKTYKEYLQLRAEKYCCTECMKRKKKTRDENGNLIFLDAPYRDKEWLYQEYIVKNRFVEDIAQECNLNKRTLLEWISKYGLQKYDFKKNKLTKEILEDLYSNQHLTTLEIGEKFGFSDATILKLLKKYDIYIPTRSELLDYYYNYKGGREIARQKYGTIENRIAISCRQRSIKVEDFDGFLKTKEARERKSSNYIQWRNEVFLRDNYTCQCCERRGGDLNAHHIKNFKDNIELRYKVNNGITLCKECHLLGYKDSFHSIYGEKNNTKEQLIEYITKRNPAKIKDLGWIFNL